MIRRAFTMRLKPDSLTEYKYHHDNIWPELVAEIERSGIASISTFQRDLDLFLVSEIEDEEAWDRLWNSQIHKRWAEVMQPLMHLREDGIVDAGELVELFHLTTSGKSNGQMSAAAVASEFKLEALDADTPLLPTAARDESNGNGLAAEVANDLLAGLMADATVEPPTAPAAEPAPQPAAEPAPTPPRKKRARPKPARKQSATKNRARKSKRKSPGKPAPAAAKKAKKKLRKKAARKKRAAPKSKPKKAARKKSTRKRARK